MIKRTYWEPEVLDEHSWRLKVIGGWVVYTESVSNKGHVALTSVYVPDRDHEWQIISRPPEFSVVSNEVPQCLL